MNSETPSIAVIKPRERKRILAITRPPLMQSAHWKATTKTVKITELMKLRA